MKLTLAFLSSRFPTLRKTSGQKIEIWEVKRAFKMKWKTFFIFKRLSLKQIKNSSPFDVCDRTSTCQHTRHWFDVCKKQHAPLLFVTLIIIAILAISYRCRRLKFNPSRPNPGRRKKIKVFFHTSLQCLKRFYEGLKGLFKNVWGTKKCENKN